MMFARIVIFFRRKRRKHTTDVLEIFIRVPAAAHTLDIELEGFVGETDLIEDTHILWAWYLY